MYDELRCILRHIQYSLTNNISIQIVCSVNFLEQNSSDALKMFSVEPRRASIAPFATFVFNVTFTAIAEEETRATLKVIGFGDEIPNVLVVGSGGHPIHIEEEALDFGPASDVGERRESRLTLTNRRKYESVLVQFDSK